MSRHDALYEAQALQKAHTWNITINGGIWGRGHCVTLFLIDHN